MLRVALAVTSAVTAFSVTLGANAQSLRVTPVTIDLPVAETSTVITLGNEAPQSLNVQARVFGGPKKMAKMF